MITAEILRCPFGYAFDFAPSFAILLRQGYEGTSFGGQAGQVLARNDIYNLFYKAC
jgi:hypothetical protein